MYEGGGTRGGRIGSAAAVICGLPLLIGGFLTALPFGDCAESMDCHAGAGRRVGVATAGAVLAATLIGLAVRAAVNRLIDRKFWRK